MLRHDGGIEEDKLPHVVLVVFGNVPLWITRSLSSSLEDFFESYRKELQVFPAFLVSSLPSPSLPELAHRDQVFRKRLERVAGTIVIGVTRAGLWDPIPPRFIFGTSLGSGIGILSTCRFERDSGSKEAAGRHLEKEVIKILGLACNLPHCNDTSCIMQYHTKVWDLDQNVDVCGTCRGNMGRALMGFFDISGSGNAGLVNFT